jgi:uracil-DNA glycosylase
MREILTTLTEELQRLKAEGVRTLPVAPESLAALTRLVRARAAESVAAPAVPTAPPPRVPPPSAPRTLTASAAAIPPPPSPRSSAALPPPPAVVISAGDKAAQLLALTAQVQADPTARALLAPGKKLVVGVGALDARIFFVGEAPGAEEEIAGEPFVGPAGQLLTKMIQAMGLRREQVYIGNIMNWRPRLPGSEGQEQVGNRPPTPEEMAYCLPYLRAQLEIVQPEFIVALGATATGGLLGVDRFKTLGEARGRWHDFANKPVMVTYHPSYILRNPTNKSKRAIWEDLLKVMERAALPITDKQRGFFL